MGSASETEIVICEHEGLALHGELIAAGADWHLAEYAHAYHAFTDPSADAPDKGRAYDPLAHRLSWAATLELLDLKLRGAQ